MKYYLPELDFSFNKYWITRGDINLIRVDLPVVSSKRSNFSSNSVFELLFNNGFSHNNYNIFFQKSKITDYPKNIIDRLSVKSPVMICYIGSEDSTSGEDILSFKDEEIMMLDELLNYRANGFCSLEAINYENLDEPLSKLIFIYLDVIHNNNLKSIDLLVEFDQPTKMIDVLFSLYVVNECHKVLKVIKTFMDNDVVELYINRNIIQVNNDILESKKLTICNPPPAQCDLVFLYHMGDLIDKDKYVCSIEDDDCSIDLGSLSFKLNDIFVTEYYSSVQTPHKSTSITTTVMDESYLLHEYLEIPKSSYIQNNNKG